MRLSPRSLSPPAGVSAHCQDSLVFETLIPKPMLQRYVSLLQEHRRIILSGPSGTGKSYLASRLAEHTVLREGLSPGPGAIATFNVDHKSSKVRPVPAATLRPVCSGLRGPSALAWVSCRSSRTCGSGDSGDGRGQGVAVKCTRTQFSDSGNEFCYCGYWSPQCCETPIPPHVCVRSQQFKVGKRGVKR